MMIQPTIGYPELQKSKLVLYDMVAFYLPLHGQGWQEFFSYYPILTMVEGLIYQVEVTMEEAGRPEATGPNLWSSKKSQIAAFLAEHQLAAPVVLHYLAEVGDYFQLVDQRKRTSNPAHADISRAMETRPADIRLLHAILLQLIKQPHDERLFDLLWPLEILLDLKANLTEYADDLVTGHYNSYQMFVKLYGAQAPAYLEAEQRRYQTILQERVARASSAHQTRLQNFMQQHEADYPSVPIPEPVFVTQ